MNFATYLENRFQEAKLREHENEQAKRPYSIWIDSEMKAVFGVMSVLRFIYKWLQVPLVFLGFFAVKLHIARAPEPAMTKLIQKQVEADKIAKAMNEKLAKEVVETMPEEDETQDPPNPTVQ